MIMMEVNLFLTDMLVAVTTFEHITTDTTMRKLAPTTCDYRLLQEPHY